MSSNHGDTNANSGGNAPALACGDAVVTPSGRIGMLVWHDNEPPRTASVQLGASGPLRHYRLSSLRHATLAEVRAAGMYGVGFRIIDEETL